MFTKKNQHVQVAAQNCSPYSYGAYTGEVTAEHIRDMNLEWVIIGHSERRQHFKESNELLAKKVENALKVGLKVIYCFGETLEQREANETMKVIEEQLNAIKEYVTDWKNIVLAYEPVWAIGTGKNATEEQVNEVHSWIRGYLQKIGEQTEATRVIYGGSVNEKNCDSLIKIKDVDGFLVGGASLKPAFMDIIKAKK